METKLCTQVALLLWWQLFIVVHRCTLEAFTCCRAHNEKAAHTCACTTSLRWQLRLLAPSASWSCSPVQLFVSVALQTGDFSSVASTSDVDIVADCIRLGPSWPVGWLLHRYRQPRTALSGCMAALGSPQSASSWASVALGDCCIIAGSPA